MRRRQSGSGADDDETTTTPRPQSATSYNKDRDHDHRYINDSVRQTRSMDSRREGGHSLGINKKEEVRKQNIRTSSSDSVNSTTALSPPGGLASPLDAGPKPRLSTSSLSPDSASNNTARARELKSDPAMIPDLGYKHRVRIRSPWSCSPLTFVTTVLAFVILATISRSFLGTQIDPKGCQMSYMRAAFAKLEDFDTEHTRFATKYSLYLYREAGIDEDTRVRYINHRPCCSAPR